MSKMIESEVGHKFPIGLEVLATMQDELVALDVTGTLQG